MKNKLDILCYAKIWLSVLLFSLVVSSCYHNKQKTHDAYPLSEKQIDSLSFFSAHHYTNNYNFVVRVDSFHLLRQLPEEKITGMPTDSFVVRKHDHLVVADIRILKTDEVDSVWVQLANDSSAFGWTHESFLLPRVYPDDPISQFISVFSDIHLIIFLIIICLMGSAYLMRQLLKRNAPIVHWHDIHSFYPTLLCIIVASSATFYASMQMFVPEMWRHFYYHPTLNPFSVPLPLGVFLTSVWSIVIVFLAALDDIRSELSAASAILYTGGLMAVCAVNYIVFSITTLYYVGYGLLAAYVVFALYRQ